MPRPIVRNIPFSLRFNAASSQYGVITNAPFANATQITVFGWLKLDSVQPVAHTFFEAGIFAGSPTSFLVSAPSNKLVVGTYQTAGPLTSQIQMVDPLPLKQWVRFCAVMDQTISSNQTAMYVNGIAPPTTRLFNQQCNGGIATQNTYIGIRQAGLLYPLDGNLIIDRVITGKAFTAAEALSEYVTGQFASGGTVLLNYAWNEGNGATVTDSSGNGKNIALTNSPTWTNDTPSNARTLITAPPFAGVSGVQYWGRASRVTMANGLVPAWGNLYPYANPTVAAENATVASQPTMSTGPNSRVPSIRFDGSNDWLRALFTLAQPQTVFIVFKLRSITGVGAGNTNYIFDGGANLNSLALAETASPDNTLIYNGTSLNTNANSGLGSFCYMTLVFNGASSVIRLNGVQVAAGDAGNAAAAGGITFASTQNFLALRFGAIDLVEAGVTNVVNPAGEISTVESYFQKFYGL